MTCLADPRVEGAADRRTYVMGVFVGLDRVLRDHETSRFADYVEFALLQLSVAQLLQMQRNMGMAQLNASAPRVEILRRRVADALSLREFCARADAEADNHADSLDEKHA